LKRHNSIERLLKYAPVAVREQFKASAMAFELNLVSSFDLADNLPSSFPFHRLVFAERTQTATGIFVTALRQKRFRRTRDESPTGCQVLAIRSDFSRAVGAVEMLAQKAAEIGQFWLRGIATARRLATA